MRQKIILQFSIMIIIMAIIITGFSSYNMRTSGINSAINKAESISEVVKNGLTSHMINGNMHQRDTFINSIMDMKNVERLWLVRGEPVISQFGKANSNELPKDDIDKAVLETGMMQYELKEEFSKTTIRVTIPYNATSDGRIDCMGCHKVKYGDTLGIVSLELDISDVKQLGLESIYIIFIVLIITIILVMVITRNILRPYLTLFEEFGKSIEKAVNGKFKLISKPYGLSDDMSTLADDFNSLISNFKNTFKDIDTKLKGFIGGTTNNNLTPLEESKEIILNLSNLYQFKKEIELDNTKEEIYTRLSEVLRNQFDIRKFTMIEIDLLKGKRYIIHQEGNAFYCDDSIKDNLENCRSARTKHDVVSTDFHSTCPCFKGEKHFYFCTNIDISKNASLVINFVFDTKEELDSVKKNIRFIKSYINEAAPSIEVKLLLEALQESAFRDGLTGLYNRKFLDEHVKKIIPQTLRENKKLAVLMLDMDHFKAVNDEYGHDIGDLVLKELARILTENLRESDVIIRFGGEEFLVMLTNIESAEDAVRIANKIRFRVSENEIDVYAGNKLRKTVSIGLAMFPEDSKSFDAVCKNADIALYEAKNSGRNQVVRFTEEQVSSVDLF